MEELFKYKGFKLIRLELRNNNLLGTINYDFIEKDDQQELIYSTVIIGTNGTGKSNLFRIIIWLFKELYDLGHDKSRSYAVQGLFTLKYSLNGDIYTYSNIHYTGTNRRFINLTAKNTSYLLINDSESPFKKDIFPIAIVAISIMLTDKFPIYNDADSFPQYKYLGVRNRPQLASTRSYVRKTVEFIVEQISSDAFKQGLNKTAKFLGINASIEVQFFTQNTTTFFKGSLSPEKIKTYFNQIEDNYKVTGKTPPFKLNHYQKIQNDVDLLELISNFCNTLYTSEKLIANYRSSAKTISYNIVDDLSHQQLKEDYILLEHLRQLGMIYAPEIKINNGSDYNLQESSSGEYHFFSTMIGLMATIKTNSLIFIDEPEISLHPNWQMKYLSFIQELFSNQNYGTCHLIIATHSHFVISDLRGENSKILGIKRVSEGLDKVKPHEKKFEIINMPKSLNTFGWSAEEVLMEIFQVYTSRNYFIAERIGQIMKKASMSQNLEEFKDELLKYRSGLTEADPLHYTLTKIAEKQKWLA